jgi:5'-nucleotidase
VSAHTHAEYRCTITTGGVTRLITSASSFGRILSDLTLTFDKAGKLVQASAENVIVDNALNAPGPGVVRVPDPSKEDPEVAAVVSQYVAAAAPLANQVIGRAQGDLTRTGTALGESTLGDVIADAQLAATEPAGLGDADLAFMNPGGIRADLLTTSIAGGEAVGEVTYGEAFTVQPFGNSLVTMTLTGAQIETLLEQQWDALGARVLQVSEGFTYTWDAAAAIGDRVDPDSIAIDGVTVDPAASYRVTVNSFLADGGDRFPILISGTDRLGGEVDLDALVTYFEENSPLEPGPQDRITRVN